MCIRDRSQVDLAGELKKIQERDLTLLTQEDELYPPLPREIYNPPLVLTVWGELTKRDHNALGVVGSRHATHYGLSTAKKLSLSLIHI